MSEREMTGILAVLRTAYPNTKIEDAGGMVKSWLGCLGEFSTAAVYKAARLHMNTSKFFPTPAEIREKIIRAELVYKNNEDETTLLPETATPEQWTDEQLEDLCKFVGFGYPNDIEGE